MQESFIKLNELELCVQTFGLATNPAIILHTGAAGQAILWNQNLCKNLAAAGYFVVRFDSRDTGKSSGIIYEQNPYSLKDMAEDIIAILDYFKIKKAHIIGSSMGGYVAQNLAIYFPERILTLSLIMTTINSLSLRGIRGINTLSGQNLAMVKQMATMYQAPRSSLEDRIKCLTDTWQLFNGNAAIFPYDEWYQLAVESYQRAKSKNAVRNHRLAILNSPADRSKGLENLTIPTLIIHGKADPIIQVDHAHYAHASLPQTKLLIIDKMGHILSSLFIEQIGDALLEHFK